MRRYWFAALVLCLGMSWVGCAGSDPEPPKESIPEIPPGRGAPGGEKMPGAPNGVPAPPK
ncbi:MAG: hypothetical protein RLY70_4221 [Planctomycetota bacterium]|jgi:hypothetical protein